MIRLHKELNLDLSYEAKMSLEFCSEKTFVINKNKNVHMITNVIKVILRH